MKKANYAILFCLFTTIFFQSSCIRDANLDYSTVKSKLVLNGLVSVSEPWTIHLSKSGIKVSDSDTIANVAEAFILLRDVTANEMIRMYPQGDGVYKSAGEKPITGHTYEFEAMHDDFTSISSAMDIPDSIDWVARVDSSSVDVGGVKQIDINIVIETYHNEKNYYIVELEEVISNGESDGSSKIGISDVMMSNEKEIEKEIQVVEGAPRFFIEEDPNDEGGTSTSIVTISLDGEDEDGEDGDSQEIPKFLVKIKTCSKDYYEYYKTLQKWREEPLKHETRVYSNVKNGFGVFGSYNLQEFSL